MPVGLLNVVWENLVGAGYMSILDGFSKISSCSTEGRSLMSMDVSAYNNGIRADSVLARLDDVTAGKASELQRGVPKNIQPYRNFVDVSTYIKIFYFPSDVSVHVAECHRR
jgi:hypothetical protein